MNKPQKHIQTLIDEACRHPVGSSIRQKRLTQIVRLISDQLWKENVSYYQDALQKTWIYFCNNLCEAKTGRVYDPQRASVVTWLNAYLKRRLQDEAIDRADKDNITAKPQPNLAGEAGVSIDPIDRLPAKPDIPPMLKEVMQWAETAPQLQQIHITGHPNITGRLLILKRLPPEIPWKVLAAELDVSIGTLASFYQRQCMPLLREFGREQGYL
ncbi:sigma-70 family RNA polymerase sigma factor [Leptolyngbya cf. ectocarpi LEGE 11479]|uniref:Sigma-70 family RNA polymerase sigma factor n=1 Tax=Leptolyngbya cf. ectocarpi LEGE 11479 TaxID=1828722 RepID=A0A928ZVM6_LEPEC|nr:sigma-70 family RNA polymerase sigma factor [Leptolyngbya ectocarpi]MBE9068305.1 sigma-70 family RNA polymerase sigma factor [Leptolyngbya cf. ectocarpi LEGE 11479]